MRWPHIVQGVSMPGKAPAAEAEAEEAARVAVPEAAEEDEEKLVDEAAVEAPARDMEHRNRSTSDPVVWRKWPQEVQGWALPLLLLPPLLLPWPADWRRTLTTSRGVATRLVTIAPKQADAALTKRPVLAYMAMASGGGEGEAGGVGVATPAGEAGAGAAAIGHEKTEGPVATRYTRVGWCFVRVCVPGGIA